MMINAYNELYLDDAMKNLGDMVDYAINDCGYEPDEFFDWFISSEVASKFENGNPKYVAGLSGIELADVVLERVKAPVKNISATQKDDKGKAYWAGWILAYYQWFSNSRFSELVKNGLSLSEVMSMYILHEADESKFVETANKIIETNKKNKTSKLQVIRKARGLTQQQLSRITGVSLRMIQLYEQKQNDINKAGVNMVSNLAKALGCEIEDLID